jgi:hypothetical protein
MRPAARNTALATCLAIVALAPTAAARPAFDPPSVSVNPSTGYTLQDKSVSQTTVVRSNPDQQVARHGVPIPPILGKTQPAQQAAIDRLKAQHYTDKLPVHAAYSAAALNGYGNGHPVNVQAIAPSAGPRHVTPTIVATRGGAVHVAPTTLATPVGARRVSPTASATPNNGFDWGDAGIGAGGAVALMTLLVGGALGMSSVRHRATRSTA